MTLTTHAALGAVIGHAAGDPALGFTLGFASHFLIDMIPHGDSGLADNYKIHKKNQKTALAFVAIDATAALFLVLVLANTRDIESVRAFSWGVAGSVLPDLIIGLYEVTKTKYLRWFNTLHFAFHDYFIKRKGDVPLYYAILAQIVLIAYLQTKL